MRTAALWSVSLSCCQTSKRFPESGIWLDYTASKWCCRAHNRKLLGASLSSPRRPRRIGGRTPRFEKMPKAREACLTDGAPQCAPPQEHFRFRGRGLCCPSRAWAGSAVRRRPRRAPSKAPRFSEMEAVRRRTAARPALMPSIARAYQAPPAGRNPAGPPAAVPAGRAMLPGGPQSVQGTPCLQSPPDRP